LISCYCHSGLAKLQQLLGFREVSGQDGADTSAECPCSLDEIKFQRRSTLINKKVMALAVAGALAAPAVAFAQASNVQIYGRANLGMDSYAATGSTAGSASDYKSRTRIFDSSSRLGFRGTEDLGNGLSAIFQLETGVGFDTGSANGQSGVANSSGGTWASRPSFAGLKGNWGQLTFGRQDIYWGNGLISQSGANYVNTDVSFATGSFGRIAGPVSRQSNTTQYTSPTFSGFNATASYSSGAQENSTTAVFYPGTTSTGSAGGPSTQNTDGKIWGLTARYTGIVNAQWDYATNEANSAVVSAPGSRPKLIGNKIGLGWPYAPGAQISVIYYQQQNNNMPATATFNAAGDNLKQTGWVINWEHMFGNIQALAMYGKLNKISGCASTVAGPTAGSNGCDGTDAKSYLIGAKYHLSKRTGVYVTYNATVNGSNQVADYNGGSYSAATSSVAGASLPFGSAGADPKIFAVGILHNF
jgi:predicted porin